jgi:hypothetical protein
MRESDAALIAEGTESQREAHALGHGTRVNAMELY